MAETKTSRVEKKQMGQFMTPIQLSSDIVSGLKFSTSDKVLEPSFGTGNFILPIIKSFLDIYHGTIEEKLTKILNNNLWGVEYDPKLYSTCLERIQQEFGFLPKTHNLILHDYFLFDLTDDIKFDYIIGNPPFGGTINIEYQDRLDYKYGTRNSHKIKKETYSFFIVKSVESLVDGGRLIFISSDTFLTIKTMKGLRLFLVESGLNSLSRLDNFSEETSYPMCILDHTKSGKSNYILFDGQIITEENMKTTDNFSWQIGSDFTPYFTGPKLKNFLIGTSGMTTGKNEYFIREISSNGTILEEYDFNFFDEPITLEKEFRRARNGKLSSFKISQFRDLESRGITRRNVSIEKKSTPQTIQLPHPDYCYYNKSNPEILYAKPDHVIYWKDDGDACITYKKNGNWYLNGVGGKPYFKREGLTWQLISSSIKAKYLPSGYILDSGAPIAVLRDGVSTSELYFILGWLITDKCNQILKGVINHTKNIQSKDVERLPYPFWVSQDNKLNAISLVQSLIETKRLEKELPYDFREKLDEFYQLK